LAGEIEVLGENLPQCSFVYHKTYMLLGRHPGPRRWEAIETNFKDVCTLWVTKMSPITLAFEAHRNYFANQWEIVTAVLRSHILEVCDRLIHYSSITLNISLADIFHVRDISEMGFTYILRWIFVYVLLILVAEVGIKQGTF
jgi:hypothetical protein